jgi:hypothetical protein
MSTGEQEERAAGVSRQLTGEGAPGDTDRESQTGPTGGGGGQQAPSDVGSSISRSGEDIKAGEGKEAGRADTGSDGTVGDRPTGESSARDLTGVDPQDGNTSRTMG